PRKSFLSLWTKLAFGSGDWSISSFGTLRQIFYAIFLTDVVGLRPGLAAVAIVVGTLWDAINDPLVGRWSDRVRSRWGRRRPFLLWFAIPYGLGFALLWWAPPFDNQYLLALSVTLAFMLADTFQTLIGVPLYALTPEITPDYDERTSLTGYRMLFNLIASLVTAVAAPEIVKAALVSGATQQQGYVIVGALFGGLAVIPLLLIFFVVRERPRSETEIRQEQATPLREVLKTAWGNIPFRFATALYMLNWITFDLVAGTIPFFLTYWVAGGNLLVRVFGLSLDSVVLGLLLIVSVLVLPFWIWLSGKLSKNIAYVIGMSFWAVVQLLIFAVQPGQITFILALATLAGISVSTAHVLPDSIFPDVIEWDELRTGRRQEGIYYGIKNFIRKLSGAVAMVIVLQALERFGYQTPPEGVTFFTQPDSAVLAIRILIGPLGAVLLFSAVLIAWFYPLTREKHARIRKLLARRKDRERRS
ncbi:MAG: glycoside-pentoside-hexuronide (GPH):cation symporter, partial [Anaerolineales bacterium]|nr:glycoside-pentoside-hexuronide (GPH):cation symporter [Anaerolineales bacterium]